MPLLGNSTKWGQNNVITRNCFTANFQNNVGVVIKLLSLPGITLGKGSPEPTYTEILRNTLAKYKTPWKIHFYLSLTEKMMGTHGVAFLIYIHIMLVSESGNNHEKLCSLPTLICCFQNVNDSCNQIWMFKAQHTWKESHA